MVVMDLQKGRLCVKGRYGFDYVNSDERLTTPLIRRDDAPKSESLPFDPSNPMTHFRPATWEEALDKAAQGFTTIRDRDGAKALAGLALLKGQTKKLIWFKKWSVQVCC